jgi:hypothetical protein
MNELEIAALEYVERGWMVFPVHTPTESGGCSCSNVECESIGKHPRTQRGLNDASRNPQDINEWWKRWPDANIGIVTGQEHGLVVVDIDLPGIENWRDLQDINSAVDTLTVSTGSGGEHYYFQTNGTKYRSTASQIDTGIDTKGEGGYVVAPPSLHASGDNYEWLDDNRLRALSDLPEWLESKMPIFDPPTKTVVTTPSTNEEPWVSKLILEGASKGERNNSATSLAGYLLNQKKLPVDIVLAQLQLFAERCDPPMSLHEVTTVVRSVQRYAADLREAGTPFLDIPTPDYREQGGSLIYTWPDIRITIEQLHRNYQGVQAEMTIERLLNDGATSVILVGPIHHGLVSTTSHNSLVKHLNDIDKESRTNWAGMLSMASRLGVAHLRTSRPAVDLRDYMDLPSDRWALSPLVLEGEPTILFGNGGEGKSLTALAALLSLETGMCVLPGMDITPGHHGIYLDWESTPDRHGVRSKQLLLGSGLDHKATPITHHRCYGPIKDQAHQLRRLIESEGATFVVIDSAGMACGGEPEKADSALQFFDIINEWNVSALVIAHQTKDQRQGMPFGSVFWHNSARSTVEVRKVQEHGSNSLAVGLFHWKSNDSYLFDPIGYQYSWYGEGDETRINVERIEVQEIAELAEHTSLTDRIVYLLGTQGPMTQTDIAGELGENAATVRARMYGGKRFVKSNHVNAQGAVLWEVSSP